MAPQVQTLAQVMAELNPAYQGQTDVIAKKQAGVGARYDSQRTALGAEKVQGFNKINDQAIGRGAAFSGIPLDEQATYLSTKYLPGMQAADSQQNEDNLTFAGKLAEIETNKRTTALGTIEKQKSDLNSWNGQLMQQEAQARENALNRAASAAEGAAGRAASASQQVPVYDQLSQRFEQMSNDYGDVTPAQWKILRTQALGAGMTQKEFADTFWNYADAKIWKQYLSK